MAVPKPMPAAASMNSKNMAARSTPQKIPHWFVPVQPWAWTMAESIRFVASKGFPASQQPTRKRTKKTITPLSAAFTCRASGIRRCMMVFFFSSSSRATSQPMDLPGLTSVSFAFSVVFMRCAP